MILMKKNSCGGYMSWWAARQRSNDPLRSEWAAFQSRSSVEQFVFLFARPVQLEFIFQP